MQIIQNNALIQTIYREAIVKRRHCRVFIWFSPYLFLTAGRCRPIISLQSNTAGALIAEIDARVRQSLGTCVDNPTVGKRKAHFIDRMGLQRFPHAFVERMRFSLAGNAPVGI